jgi:hypothetical protein
VAIFEGELGDAGFVEVAEAFIAVHSAPVALREGILCPRSPTDVALRARANFQDGNPAKSKTTVRGKPYETFASALGDASAARQLDLFNCYLARQQLRQQTKHPTVGDHLAGSGMAVTTTRPPIISTFSGNNVPPTQGPPAHFPVAGSYREP